MKWTERSRLAVLMVLHLLWGMVLWFSISKYGLGVSTDSVQILFGGLNWSEGRGLLSYDGSFVMLWPPLYPVLLGLIHAVSGLGIFAATHVLQALAFVGLSYCLAVLFVRIFASNFALAVIATVLSDIGVVVLTNFDMVGSDYLHLFLAMLFVLLTGLYLESGSARTFMALAVVGMLATLTRYLGVAVVATGAILILALGKGKPGQRLLRAAFIGLSAVPAGVWLAVTSQLYGRRAPISFEENFNWFSRSILEWFFESKEVRHGLALHITWLWIVVLALIVILIAFTFWRRPKTESKDGVEAGTAPRAEIFLVALLGYGLLYTLALFGSASLAYFNKLGGRFLLPLYIPLVILPIAAADVVVRRANERGAAELRLAVAGVTYALLVGMGLLLQQITLPLVIQSHSRGAVGGENAFNTKSWRENPAVQYWLGHVPTKQYLLFSNEPDGAAFYTQHAVSAAPRRTSGPYGTDQYALTGYTGELFASEVDVYLLWIAPNPYPFYYEVDELKAIATVKPIVVSEAGGLYQLSPKTGS